MNEEHTSHSQNPEAIFLEKVGWTIPSGPHCITDGPWDGFVVAFLGVVDAAAPEPFPPTQPMMTAK